MLMKQAQTGNLSALGGALLGGGVGIAASPEDSVAGPLIGAGVGTLLGSVIGNELAFRRAVGEKKYQEIFDKERERNIKNTKPIT